MSNWVGTSLKPESQFAAAGLLDKSLSCGTLRPKNVVRILCSSPSPPASTFSSQRVAVQNQKGSSVVEQTQEIGSNKRQRSHKTITRVASISSPGFPTFPDDDGYLKGTQNGASTSSRAARVEVSAKGKWHRLNDSSLSEDEPLPLPMTWPNSEPSSAEKVNEMLRCDPEKQTCKEVIYQWTGDCKSCQGTGLVSFYRKKRNITSKCINCLGIGSVNKITSRADFQDMGGTEGNSNGSVRGSGTNGKV